MTEKIIIKIQIEDKELIEKLKPLRDKLSISQITLVVVPDDLKYIAAEMVKDYHTLFWNPIYLVYPDCMIGKWRLNWKELTLNKHE